MAQVRGNTLASGVADLKRRYGEDVFKKIIAAMQPEHAKVLDGGIARTGWYPFEAYIDFCMTGDRLLGKGDFSHTRSVAADAATADLSIFLKVYVTVFSTPSEVLARLPSVWGRYYDSGKLVVTSDTPTQVTFELRDFPTPHAMHCTILEGWTERFLQLTLKRKGKTARCTHPRCRTKGAPVCEFVVDFV
jgi:hypothetical protein